MTYMGYQGAGHFMEGGYVPRVPVGPSDLRSAISPMNSSHPRYDVPGVMSFEGKPLGGWAQYQPLAHASRVVVAPVYLQWRYLADRNTLAHGCYFRLVQRSRPGLAELLKPDAKGRLVLPTSSSPEVFDNSQRAWLKPNSNFDLAILRMLFLSLKEMAVELDRTVEAERWAQTRRGPRAVPHRRRRQRCA